jgi:hypothetical protein
MILNNQINNYFVTLQILIKLTFNDFYSDRINYWSPKKIYFIIRQQFKAMKFNPLTKKLYSNKGEFIKKLQCSYKINWNNLERQNDTTRICSNCNHPIIDTSMHSDEELLALVNSNSETCLKIDLNQENLEVNILWKR